EGGHGGDVSRYVFKLPDLGEGTVDAEIVAWRVKPGDVIAEDDALVEVMTEKATVEVPAPVGGRVVAVSGTPGERITVGSELAVFETEAASAPPVEAPESRSNGGSQSNRIEAVSGGGEPTAASAARSGRVLTSPAIRRQAREAGIDLSAVAGSGPSGRIVRSDIAAHLQARAPEAPRAEVRQADHGEGVEEVKVIGLRRVIAERISESARTIPHFSYVEEVDVTGLEALRTHLNEKRKSDSAPLTYLPFLVLALTRTLAAHSQCNALYDSGRGVIVRHRAVHVGIATQTRDGLKVPVVRNAERRSLEDLAIEIRRLSEAARNGSATRAELGGSTITVTSLGKLGGIASTPIINAPELAIIGVNRAVERPVVVGGAVAIRRMMNLSSSFDHRFVDGHDAAAMIQSLKEQLEHPATIFMA
ncbi:MAG TPA: dihydrolipoamide acetyltransferase family protein, partial [Steroidobacteraceae bacterium]|nr:dihydrolipoamide acetyltransferase family protein [Steroidobacteraceae bacterium]